MTRTLPFAGLVFLSPPAAAQAQAVYKCADASRITFQLITDDEVLTLPGWGRPSATDRFRDRRGWQERWTYAASPDGGALYLRFLNGKLASVETQ